MNSAQALSKHSRLILWWVNRFTIPGQDEEDLRQIAQSTFCLAWDKSDSDAQEKLRVSYSIRAVKHALIAHLKRTQTDSRTGITLSFDQPLGDHGVTLLETFPGSQDAEYDDRSDFLTAALRKLPEKDQTLLKRVYFDGEPVIAIGESMGLTRGAIYNRLKKAEARLRNELTEPVLREMRES